MNYHSLFPKKGIIIGCIHLRPLPGSPLYTGNLTAVYEQALHEASLYQQAGVDALIMENFHDMPFFPQRVPAYTVAAMTAIGRELTRAIDIPLGINVLRNDAESAMAIATAIEAQFIRVNIHIGAYVADQGLIQGNAHLSTRLRSRLKSSVLIFADVHVKHAAPLADRGLLEETQDLVYRGLADAVIVSGSRTGAATSPETVNAIKAKADVPLLIGSGVNPHNIKNLSQADGFIVGSYFKEEGKVSNAVDPQRIKTLLQAAKSLR